MKGLGISIWVCATRFTSHVMLSKQNGALRCSKTIVAVGLYLERGSCWGQELHTPTQDFMSLDVFQQHPRPNTKRATATVGRTIIAISNARSDGTAFLLMKDGYILKNDNEEKRGRVLFGSILTSAWMNITTKVIDILYRLYPLFLCCGILHLPSEWT